MVQQGREADPLHLLTDPKLRQDNVTQVIVCQTLIRAPNRLEAHPNLNSYGC